MRDGIKVQEKNYVRLFRSYAIVESPGPGRDSQDSCPELLRFPEYTPLDAAEMEHKVPVKYYGYGLMIRKNTLLQGNSPLSRISIGRKKIQVSGNPFNSLVRDSFFS